jgi:undecaprenyl-diphosphatase
VFVALASAAVVVLLGYAVHIGWAPLLRLDASIDDALHGWALGASWAVELSRSLDTIGRFAVSFWVTTATVVVLLIARRWRLALGVAGIAIVAPLVTDGIKVVVERSRPVWEDPLWTEGTFSYPSGHATAGLAVYAVCGIALASLLRDRRWALVVAVSATVFGLLIGVSRLVLGVHWPSDVVGGWCVAVAVAAAFFALLLPFPRRSEA